LLHIDPDPLCLSPPSFERQAEYQDSTARLIICKYSVVMTHDIYD